MAEISQTVVTASVHPRQPLSLIQDGADRVSPAQGSGLCSNLVDKNDKHVCSLLVQIVCCVLIQFFSVLSIKHRWRTNKTKSGASSVSGGNMLEVTLCLEIMRLKINAMK
jgi:hypothetical protein